MWLLLLLLPMVGMLAGFMAGAVGSYVAPRKFESTAVVQVMPMVDGAMILGDAVVTQVTPGQFFATEREVIRSRGTLERVVNALDLVGRWNLPVEECVETLKEIVRVEQIRRTDLIEIRVRHARAEDAKDVAEEVVTQYQDRRVSREVARASNILEELDAELRKQEGLVEEKRKVLDTIVQAVGISMIDREAGVIYGNPAPTIAELDRDRESLELQVSKLEELSNEELLGYAAGLQLPQNGVSARYEEYRSELVALNDLLDGGMGDAHPKVVAQRVRVDMLRQDLYRSANVLREVMKTQLELVNARVEKMRKVLGEEREEAVVRGDGKEDYLLAKRDYEEVLAVLQRQKLEQSERRIMAAIPKHPVTLHELPKIGRNPVTPRVSLCLGGGALGGAALGVVLALVIGLAGKLAGRKAG